MRVSYEPRDTPTTSFRQARVQPKKIKFTDFVTNLGIHLQHLPRQARVQPKKIKFFGKNKESWLVTNPEIHIQHLPGRPECYLRNMNKNY